MNLNIIKTDQKKKKLRTPILLKTFKAFYGTNWVGIQNPSITIDYTFENTIDDNTENVFHNA